MAKLITLPLFNDERGFLYVCDNILPFQVKRFYFFKNSVGMRGGCKHYKSTQAIICIQGKCSVCVNNNSTEVCVKLDCPTKCLIIQPGDWHELSDFSDDSVVLVLSSESFNKEDFHFAK